MQQVIFGVNVVLGQHWASIECYSSEELVLTLRELPGHSAGEVFRIPLRLQSMLAGNFCVASLYHPFSTFFDHIDHILGGGFIFFWKTFHPYKLEMIPICTIFQMGWTVQPPGSIYPSMDFCFQPRYGNPLYLPDQQVGLNTLAVPPRLGRNKKNMRRVDIYNHNWPDVNVSLCNPYPFVINYI